MTTIFQSNKDEFLRIVQLVKAMTVLEAVRFLSYRHRTGYYARLLAPALGISSSNKFLMNLSREIHAHLKLNSPKEPLRPQPEIPKVSGKACDGCGGIGDSPKMLRWAKVARGEPVTISVDETDKPATLHWLTPEIIRKEWFAPWEVDTSIRFKLLAAGEGKGDIHIRFDFIDGPGATQGIAWLPKQSVEFMEQGGDLSGDMVIDKDERWTSEEETHEVGEHEGGHVIGCPHTQNPDDVLYPYTRGFRRPHSLNDKRAKTLRYPPVQPRIAA